MQKITENRRLAAPKDDSLPCRGGRGAQAAVLEPTCPYAQGLKLHESHARPSRSETVSLPVSHKHHVTPQESEIRRRTVHQIEWSHLRHTRSPSGTACHTHFLAVRHEHHGGPSHSLQPLAELCGMLYY